jgi:tetratricopeptide (TPR) repeat protein
VKHDALYIEISPDSNSYCAAFLRGAPARKEILNKNGFSPIILTKDHEKAYRGLKNKEVTGAMNTVVPTVQRRIIKDGKFKAAKPEKGPALFKKALELSREKNYAEAIKTFSSCIRVMPDSASAYYNRGLIYQYIGRHDMAISDYTKAIDCSRFNPDAYYNRAVAYHHLGDLGRAIKDYTKAIELNPDDAYAYWNRGVAFSDGKDYEQAALDYCKAVDIKQQVTDFTRSSAG